MNARWSGWRFGSAPKPSSVVTLLPTAASTGRTHEGLALPSIRTLHAPHWLKPQPKRGPESSRSLRRTYSKGVPDSTVTVRAAPFTLSAKDCDIDSPGRDWLVFGPAATT